MDSSRRALLAGVSAGVFGLAGCLGSDGCTPMPPTDIESEVQLHQVALDGTQYQIEVLRDDEQKRRGLQLAGALEQAGMSVTTSDVWSSSSGGVRWNLWAYGTLPEQDVQAYIDEYDVDAVVTARSEPPRGSHIITDSPFATPERWFSSGGEFAHRQAIWSGLTDRLRPFELYNIQSGSDCIAFYQDPTRNYGAYIQKLVERRGHVNLAADGVSPSESDRDTPRLRPGRLVEPRNAPAGEVYHDPSELGFTEYAVDAVDTQEWELHWETPWELAPTHIRITGEFLGIGLPELVEWYQDQFDDTPTTITLRVDQHRVVSERLASLVENPSQPDTYGDSDGGDSTVLPRVPAETAALIATYMAAPYDIGLGSALTVVTE